MEASGSLMASSAIADVNSSASMSAVLRMASSAMSDVNSPSSMSALLRMASSAMSDVNSFSSMSAVALMASSAFNALMPFKAIADVNSLLRCLQLMPLDAIFSCRDGLMAADVNSSLLRCLPARHWCTDGHCMRPLDLLDVLSACRRVWDEMMPLEILGSEGGVVVIKSL